jgi:hypothetical protein
MQRLINTIATSAAVVALMAGLWQDWSLLTTLKRMLITYLGFFFLGSLMVLLVKAGSLFEKPAEVEETPLAEPEPKSRKTA